MFPLVYPGKQVPKLNENWFEAFKKRQNIFSSKYKGEGGSVNTEAIAARMKEIQDLISKYPPSHVYNCDETALYWKLFPTKGYVTKHHRGVKKNKVRVTIHLAVNADASDKRRPLYIGSSKPRALGNLWAVPLGWTWRNNKKGWMTAVLLKEWLISFNHDMRLQEKKNCCLWIIVPLIQRV